jgi:hypothetical protein
MMHAVDSAVQQAELDLSTLVRTRGRNMPLAGLRERTMCAGCDNRCVNMTYTVQIADSNGGGSVPWYEMPGRFATIPLAEEAGMAEVARLRSEGKRAFYNVLDQDGRPIGPTGPPDIPEGFGAM